VPRLLTADQKRNRINISEQWLERFNENKTDFLRRFITAVETWIWNYTPESKESIGGHGLKMHHSLLPYKGSLRGINHQLLHRWTVQNLGPINKQARNTQHKKVKKSFPWT
jgi:hypothetical protein